MTIRIMTIDDYDGLYALWTSCKGMSLKPREDSREGIEAFLKRNPDTCFVAEEDSRIIGSILVGNDGRRGYIYHTAVAEDMRRRGIASQLVNTAEEALKAAGIGKSALLAFRDNEEGNAFWAREGYVAREPLIFRIKRLLEPD